MSTMKHSRAHIHETTSAGQRIADAVARQMGSWRFIIIQSAVVGLWILVNLVAVVLRFDPYPFILLNLLFSTQAAYAAPIIMMSQNRQAEKDHLRDDHEAAEVDEMYQINEQQLTILQQQDVVLAMLRQLVKDDDAPEAPPSAPPAPPAPSQPVGAHKPKPKRSPPVLAVPVRRRRNIA